MKSRHKKLALIGGALAVVGIASALVLNALNSNIALYITPTEVAEGKAPSGKLFRIGGLVKEGSIERQADGEWQVVGIMQLRVSPVEGVLPAFAHRHRNQMVHAVAFFRSLERVLAGAPVGIAGAGALAGAGARAPPSSAEITSPFVIRPAKPVFAAAGASVAPERTTLRER